MNASLLAYILIRKLVDHIHVHTNIPVYVGTYSKTLVIGLIPTYRNLFVQTSHRNKSRTVGPISQASFYFPVPGK